MNFQPECSEKSLKYSPHLCNQSPMSDEDTDIRWNFFSKYPSHLLIAGAEWTRAAVEGSRLALAVTSPLLIRTSLALTWMFIKKPKKKKKTASMIETFLIISCFSLDQFLELADWAASRRTDHVLYRHVWPGGGCCHFFWLQCWLGVVLEL